MRVGYARVSTDDQNLDRQRAALAEAGCAEVIEEIESGVKARNRLVALLVSFDCRRRIGCKKPGPARPPRRRIGRPSR